MRYVLLGAAALMLPLAGGCATTASGEAAYHEDESVIDTTTVEEPIMLAADPVADEQIMMVEEPPAIPPVLNSVDFLTPELEEVLVVTKINHQVTGGGTLRVLCTMRNLTSEPLQVKARTQYFAEDRTHQEGPGAWQMIFLPPNGMETYESYSLGRNLSYYYVEVQEL